MTRTIIKPVLGYGDALKDYNQVPVFTLADRVRRDIMWPVLDHRSDSVLNRSNAKFMRSANGSALIDKPPESLSFIEQVDTSVTAETDYNKRQFAAVGVWIGVLITSVEGDVTTLTLQAPDRTAIAVLTFGEVAIWFRCLQFALRMKCNGSAPNKCYLSMYSLA